MPEENLHQFQLWLAGVAAAAVSVALCRLGQDALLAVRVTRQSADYAYPSPQLHAKVKSQKRQRKVGEAQLKTNRPRLCLGTQRESGSKHVPPFLPPRFTNNADEKTSRKELPNPLRMEADHGK